MKKLDTLSKELLFDFVFHASLGADRGGENRDLIDLGLLRWSYKGCVGPFSDPQLVPTKKGRILLNRLSQVKIPGSDEETGSERALDLAAACGRSVETLRKTVDKLVSALEEITALQKQLSS